MESATRGFMHLICNAAMVQSLGYKCNDMKPHSCWTILWPRFLVLS